MTIDAVAVGDPVSASKTNQLIDNVNGSPNRVVFVVNGSWSVPSGCHRFKVTLCGGGGAGGSATTFGGGEDSTIIPGQPGGDGPMISAIIAGQEIGSTFAIVVGAGGTSGSGGTSSFGTLMSSTGGAAGGSGAYADKGSPGTATFPLGAPSIFHTNELFGHGYEVNELRGYGRGGRGGDSGFGSGYDGRPGIVVIEW